MRNQPEAPHSTGATSFMNRRRRAVSPSGADQQNIVQIRPGRWLHVLHLQPEGKAKHGSDTTSQGGASQGPQDDDSGTGLCDGSITVDTKCLEHTYGHNCESSCQTQSISGKNHVDTNKYNCDCGPTGPSVNSASSGTITHRVHTKEKTTTSSVADPTVSRGTKWASQVSLISLIEEPGTVLFFLHGVGGSADVWCHQLRYFRQKGFEMVVPDMLGHGLSRAPKDTSAYTFQELSKDMLAVFDRYSKKRNILIGHSYGGSFCTLIARERSRRVTKLVLISNGGPIPLSPDTCHLFCLPSCFLGCIKPIINRRFARQAFHKGSKHTQEDLRTAFDIPAYVLRGTMQGQHWPEGGNAYHEDLSVAVLIVHGAMDEFVRQEESELMQETIYASQLEVIESAGHMVMVEQPDKVNELLHAFILRDMTVARVVPYRRAQGLAAGEGGISVSPLQRHKTVPNISMTS
ncbi:protein ABHD8-like [Diadema antillarum]|uniref:protein ABHD8-like n=1 Tax=Diadema antillarum TaxID=105358 RepID=UPI003A8758E0